MCESLSGLLSPPRWLFTLGFITILHLSKQFEAAVRTKQLSLLSPGCTNERWTHLDCLKGSIAVRLGDTSQIVTPPPTNTITRGVIKSHRNTFNPAVCACFCFCFVFLIEHTQTLNYFHIIIHNSLHPYSSEGYSFALLL